MNELKAVLIVLGFILSGIAIPYLITIIPFKKNLEDYECSNCGAIGKAEITGAYDQFLWFECEYCGTNMDTVLF